MKVRVVTEEKIRMMDFYLARTQVLAAGERDVFLPVEGEEDLEIHALLVPNRAAGSAMMDFDSVSIVNSRADGLPLRVTGEDGRTLDKEMVEVMAWEELEKNDTVLEWYSYGRSPAVVGNGLKAPPGTIIEREECPDDRYPEPDF
ncbi:MAG: hypothetical protein ABJN42_20980 [Roseibium sp.]|uniref:hypothetical protein n=1 Tax=Roseibium sp. TaxID=1936156 RepID=UPI0032979730